MKILCISQTRDRETKGLCCLMYVLLCIEVLVILLQLIKKVYLDLKGRSSSVRPNFTTSEKLLAVALGQLGALLLYVYFTVEVF